MAEASPAKPRPLADKRTPLANQSLERLIELRDTYVEGITNKRYLNAQEHEWALLPIKHRMLLLLLAGLDGDLSELALREWREMPDPERDAVKAEVRALKNGFKRVTALASRTSLQ